MQSHLWRFRSCRLDALIWQREAAGCLTAMPVGAISPFSSPRQCAAASPWHARCTPNHHKRSAPPLCPPPGAGVGGGAAWARPPRGCEPAAANPRRLARDLPPTPRRTPTARAGRGAVTHGAGFAADRGRWWGWREKEEHWGGGPAVSGAHAGGAPAPPTRAAAPQTGHDVSVGRGSVWRERAGGSRQKVESGDGGPRSP